MRVTNRTLLNNYLANLNRNLRRMSKYQDQLSSGKEIRRPSDDPIGATRSMALHTSLNQNKQYLRNIEDSLGWVDITDSALGNMGDIMNRLRTVEANDPIDAIEMPSDEVYSSSTDGTDQNATMMGGTYLRAKRQNLLPCRSYKWILIEYSGDHHMLKRDFPNVVIEVNIPVEWIMR